MAKGSFFLKPSFPGTIALLVTIGIAYATFPSETIASEMARKAAIPIGVGYLISILFDIQEGGLRNLFRTDLLCLVGIYALTLAEFLFPQEIFDTMVNAEETALALHMTLPGIAALAIGRHLVAAKEMKSKFLTLRDLSNEALFKIVVVCAFTGFLYMLMAVKFKLFGDKSLIYYLMGKRFSEPWVRGRLGGLSTLLGEFALLLYAVPPLTGVIINRWRTFPKPQFIGIILIFLLVMFQGFAGGTRNVFVSYMATFLMGYFLTLKKNTIVNTVLPLLFSVWLIGFASYHMLEFRTMGLRAYLENKVYESEATRETLAVDYNLASMGKVAANVPSVHRFLGSEIIVWSIVKPIPRAFWKGKPEGLSVSLEDMAGAGGWTIAVTFIGEAYVSGGVPAVVIISLGLGALAAWWNRMAIASQTDYGLVVYALGFFAAGITMRSISWLTTAMLPVIALILFRKYAPLK